MAVPSTVTQTGGKVAGNSATAGKRRRVRSLSLKHCLSGSGGITHEEDWHDPPPWNPIRDSLIVFIVEIGGTDVSDHDRLAGVQFAPFSRELKGDKRAGRKFVVDRGQAPSRSVVRQRQSQLVQGWVMADEQN